MRILKSLKLNFIFLFVVGIITTSCATSLKLPIRKPYLFEISKNEQTAYIFGTIHVGIDKDQLPDKFWTYIDHSDILFTEFDLEKDPNFKKEFLEAVEQKIQRSGKKPEIKSLLTRDEYASVKARLQQLHPPDDPSDTDGFLQVFSPYGLLTMLEPPILLKKLQSEDLEQMRSGTLLDDQIRNYASNRNIKVAELDSYDSYQMIKCITGTDESNIQQIKELLKKDFIADKTNALTDFLRNYRNGQMSNDMTTPADSCLVNERNILWMKKIRETFEYYRKPFFVVGVSHLIDKKTNLLDMLKSEGYRIRRVESLDLK